MEKIVLALFTAVLFTFSLPTQASLIDSSLWDVTDISGEWSLGSTGFNLETPLSSADYAKALLSDGYIDNFDRTTVNGIYTYPYGESSLTFGTGGVDYYLNTFSFITTRNYSDVTQIKLDYRLDGGAWNNAITTTTESLLSPLSTCFPGGNDCAGVTATMSFSGVLADEWRWTRVSGSQVSLHEVMIDGYISSVPEPATFALLGLGLAGITFSRKRKRG